tara:strand:- start:21 stop:182 length:162 start_codon:yes stop_codon:yes gene_type:complete
MFGVSAIPMIVMTTNSEVIVLVFTIPPVADENFSFKTVLFVKKHRNQFDYALN